MFPVNWDELAWDNVSEGLQRKVVHGEALTMVLVRFAPGLTTPGHTHFNEQLTHIVSGTAFFTVENAKHELRAGDMLHFPPNVRHGATAGKEGLELLDIFTPRRDEFPASAKIEK